MTNKHYQNHKERFLKKARERYQNLFEGEKDKKWKKVWERYQNLTEEEKEKRGKKAKGSWVQKKLLFNT